MRVWRDFFHTLFARTPNTVQKKIFRLQLLELPTNASSPMRIGHSKQLKPREEVRIFGEQRQRIASLVRPPAE
jgi:hypothetical protein